MDDDIVFSNRLCKICHLEFPAREFGMHCYAHGQRLAKWPGGIDGFYADLMISLDQSIIEAEGHPEVQANLRDGWELVTRIRKAEHGHEN